jgi:hypothetical protein
MTDIARNIRRKWHEQTKECKGYFIRFIDGNTRNCRVENLTYVSPLEAFQNITNWRVDWDMELTKKEIQFVYDNLQNFITLYTPNE